MADVTGAYITETPIISQNASSIIRYRSKYYSDTDDISLPLIKGTRYILFAVITTGNIIEIGFGQIAGTITDSRFSLTTPAGTGGIDLSEFFNSAPFTQYKEASAAFNYFIIKASAGESVVAAISELKV
jgi:hypothetical protein